MTLTTATAAVAPSTLTLGAFLAPALRLTDAEMSAIDRGRSLGKVLPSRSGAEIFVLGVVHINAPPDAYIARALDPRRLMIMPGYRGIGLIWAITIGCWPLSAKNATSGIVRSRSRGLHAVACTRLSRRAGGA